MIKIRVPATSANLGIGFDCLGMAINQFATFYFSKHHELMITGCEPGYDTENNLVYHAYLRTIKHLQRNPDPLRIHVDSDIPMSRGLGSSASFIVAGVLAAYHLTNTPYQTEEIIQLCTELEGHPDNVVPAILGGLVASMQSNKSIETHVYPVHSNYHFVIFVPDFTLSTQVARDALPEYIAHHEAVENQTKLLFALHSFADGNQDLLKECLDDALHEPYRKQFIPEFDTIKDIVRNTGGLTAIISGSGPTLLGIYTNDIPLGALRHHIHRLKYQWNVLEVTIDTKGAEVCSTNS